MTADSPAIATLIAVFVSAIGEAMNGRPNPPALQQAIFLLLQAAQATPDMLAELQALLISYPLDGIYTLVPPGG
jgi:hypothetical protein